MKITSSFLTVTALTVGTLSLSAQVTFDFTTDAGGFTANAATSVGQNALNGGSLEVIGAPGGADFWQADSQATTLSYITSSSLANELAQAYIFGGTISFDVIINEDDINWTGATRPGLLELITRVPNDFEVTLLSVPDAGETTTKSVSMTINAGSGSDGNATNGSINFDNSSSGNISFGLKDQNGFITDATFYLDNITVSAIPEPSTYAAFAGLLVLACATLRRRK